MSSRPPAPAGSVYFSDLLDRVRAHAIKNEWCGDAETLVLESFGMDVDNTLNDVPAWCCEECDGDSSNWNHDDRFRLADDPDRLVTLHAVKLAIQHARRENNSPDVQGLYRELVSAYNLPDHTLTP